MLDDAFAVNATIVGNCVSRSLAAITRIVAIVAVSTTGVFRERALGNTEFSILDVSAFDAIISVRTGTTSFALFVAVSASLLVNLVNTGEKN